jgi:hypothetical protein
MIENAESHVILILQTHLINNLESKFGDEVKSKQIYETPGTPIFKVICADNDEDIIEPDLQSTVLELECCFISSSILDMICAILLGSCQSVWTR